VPTIEQVAARLEALEQGMKDQARTMTDERSRLTKEFERLEEHLRMLSRRVPAAPLPTPIDPEPDIPPTNGSAA
jgi:hypothetical protein